MRPPTPGNTVLEALIALRQFLAALLGWAVGYPLTRLVRRDPHLILVIARPGFSDNSKYFYLYAAEQLAGRGRVVLLTADSAIRRQVIEAGGEAVAHPSWSSLHLLLRCGTVATDVSAWFDHGAYPLTQGAMRVQMWHGAPLKHIELALFEQRLSRLPVWLRPLLRIQKAVIGRFPRYDLVVATSQAFIRDAFARSFRAREFVATGYPRNDILFGWPPADTLAGRLAAINVDHETLRRVSEARQSGWTVCLYVPTFRKDMGCSFAGAVDLGRLSAFAGQHRLLVVLKLHPFLHGMHSLQEYPYLIEYEAQADVYPLMPLTDVLITDYSSIFFDFLLLDRPIVFLAHDLETYVRHDRAMYFDFETMTPGVKCRTQDDLEQTLLSIQAGRGCDDQAEIRERIRAYTHDWHDGNSAQRLITACIFPTRLSIKRMVISMKTPKRKLTLERFYRIEEAWDKKKFNHNTFIVYHADEQQKLFSGSVVSDAYEYRSCPVCGDGRYVILHKKTKYKSKIKNAALSFSSIIIEYMINMIGTKKTLSILSMAAKKDITEEKVFNLKNRGYTVVECINCHMLYRNPTYRPKALEKAYNSGDYSNFLKGEYSKNRVNLYQKALDLIGFFEKTNEFSRRRVLDIGCGYGLFMDFIKNKGWDPYGLDFSSDSISFAKKEMKLKNAFVGNLMQDAFEEEFFDAVTLWSVVAHLEDPIDMFKRIRRVLRKGGYLVIYTVNAESIRHKIDMEYWSGFTKNHLVFFSLETLTSALKSAGFSDVYSTWDDRAFDEWIKSGTIKIEDADFFRMTARMKNYGEMQCVLVQK